MGMRVKTGRDWKVNRDVRGVEVLSCGRWFDC